MSYTTINKSSDHFNTKTYSGTGAIQTISGIGLEPSWIWIKSRTNAGNHKLTNTAQGLTYYNRANGTNAQENHTDSITATNNDGFVLGADSTNDFNANGQSYVSWNWKGGTTSGLSGGDITPSSYSYNAVAGFGVYKYSGNGSDNQTIVHGLGATPSAVLFKSLTNTEAWRYHYEDRGQFFTHRQILDDNVANAGQTDGLKAASSTTVTLGNGGAYNTNGQTYIMYLFVEKTGYSKFSHYVGNGNTNGTFIYTGFKPAFIITKNQNATDSWILLDNRRDVAPNPHKLALFPNGTDTEAGDYLTDFYSNGFKIRSATGSLNTNGSVYLYLALAEAPLVGSNNIPCTAK